MPRSRNLLALALCALGSCSSGGPSPTADHRQAAERADAASPREAGTAEARPADGGRDQLAPDLVPGPKCVDSTPAGSCSTQKPLRCNSSLKLEHDCPACGCPGFEACNTTTKGCAPVTLTLSPIGDAYVVEPSPAQNFGAETSLKLGRAWNGLTDAFLDFDLSTIPGQAWIDSATLTVDVIGWSGTPLPVTVSIVAAPWAEQQITWAAAPAVKVLPVANLDLTFSANAIDAKQLVAGWLASSIVPHGFRIRVSGSSNNNLSLASREHGTASARPQLTVTYR